jgi:putative membrane protein
MNNNQTVKQQTGKSSPMQLLLHVIQGALIGLGAVLPGISGGVLSVIFGIYKPVMELLSNPFANFKTHVPRLIPYLIGGAVGFLGVANVLAFFLEKYPDPSVCLFVGLIAGMLPSLFREAGEQGRSKGSFISLIVCMIFIFVLLTALNYASVQITPNFFWYLFCGFCLALSVIAPGMSFSTLLMPLGLYTPFVDGIGHLDFSILIPGGIGALVTVICFAKAINALFDHYYSIAFHGIIGIVIAATVMIIPFSSFMTAGTAVVNGICLVAGVVIALLLDRFNSRVEVG